MTTVKAMQRRIVLAVSSSLALSLGATPLAAQQADIEELRQNIGLLGGVLEEALNLNESSGLFGIALGGIESTYLHGQGIVMEVQTPLANRRNRLSLASLTSTMQSLGARANPFEAMRRGTAVEEPALTEPAGDPSDTFYRQMMDRIAGIDYSLIVNTAIQQASNAARSLRSLGELDDDAYQQLQAEIEALRQRMQSGMNDLRSLEAEIRQSGGDATAARDALSARVDALLARIEPLREEAVDYARELRQRTEEAQARYAEVWQQERQQLETDLYTALCDFGASLRALPAGERLSIILTGLGEDADDNRRTDKVHVLSKSDIQECQSGAIDAVALRGRSVEYSY